eukprot:8500705-Ditylum_brightwellii.AAC.1
MSNETDGLMIDNIVHEMKLFDSNNPGASWFSWKFHCSLAFDSMTCKGRFVVNFHTNEIVGLARDCLTPDENCEELLEVHLNEEDKNGHVNIDPVPELARYFL